MTITEEAIRTLQKESETNPKFQALFEILSKRIRNRHNLTTKGLYYKMRKEGLHYPERDFIPLFEFMSSLGLCKLQKNHKNKVIACKDFVVPIRELGKAVLHTGYTVQTPRTVKAAVDTLVETKQGIDKESLYPHGIILMVYLHNKPVKIEVPENITKEELVGILYKFQELNHGTK